MAAGAVRGKAAAVKTLDPEVLKGLARQTEIEAGDGAATTASAERAQMAAPAVAHDKKVEQKHREQYCPGEADAENQAPVEHGDRIHHLPGNAPGGGGRCQRHGE